MIKTMLGYIERDQNAKYGLERQASITLAGDNISLPNNVDCGVLHICNIGQGQVSIMCDQFDAESGLWNGPDIIPDNLKDGSFEASLWHDLIWFYADEIADATGMTASAVKQWGNDIFYAAWVYYASLYGKRVTLRARIAYWAVSIAKNWYGKVKALLPIFAITIVCSCFFAGCYTPPDWKVIDATQIESLECGGAEGEPA